MEAFSGPFICSQKKSEPCTFPGWRTAPGRAAPDSRGPRRFSKRGRKAGRAPVSAALHAPESSAAFATGLIAAKPEKPCDRGVFGAFYLLLFLQQSRRSCAFRASRLTDFAARLQSLCFLEIWPKRLTQRFRRFFPMPFSAPQAIAYFAPVLIAAKPEKPCDGGVLGAFYLLLKTERCMPASVFCTTARRRASAYALTSSATARASMLSPRPTGPSFSAVLAFTFTCPGATPRALAMRCVMAGR